MKLQKIELKQSLKAEDFDADADAIATAFIKNVEEVKTKFNEEGEKSLLMTIEDVTEEDAKKQIKSLFINMTSLNNCIDAFGDDTKLWIGKSIKVVCNKENFYNKKQLVVEAIN